MKRTMLLLSIFLLATLISGWVSLAEAQQTGKVYRIGYLRYGTGGPTTSIAYMGIRQALRDLGYVEGQNLVIEYRSAKGEPERYPDLAAELIRLKVDVIVASPSLRVNRALQRATRTIPIVMSGILYDPVKTGLVVSLARPGGNITGLTNPTAQLHAKRLEIFKEAVPRISRVAILWPPRQRRDAIKEVEAVAQALGIQIQSLIVQDLGDVESAFSAILRSARAQPRESPRGLLLAPNSYMVAHAARIVEFAAKSRLPAMYPRSQFVDAGGLMYFAPDIPELHRRIATYVDKILKGTKPGDLPIEHSTKFDFVINLRTATQLSITIPPTVLYRATKVIK